MNDVTNSWPTEPAQFSANEAPAPGASRLASAHQAVIGLTEVLESSIDLLGATLREEAANVPGLVLRTAAAMFAGVVGASFLTAAAALSLRDLFGAWPPTFLTLGAFYAVSGVVVWKSGRARP